MVNKNKGFGTKKEAEVKPQPMTHYQRANKMYALLFRCEMPMPFDEDDSQESCDLAIATWAEMALGEMAVKNHPLKRLKTVPELLNWFNKKYPLAGTEEPTETDELKTIPLSKAEFTYLCKQLNDIESESSADKRRKIITSTLNTDDPLLTKINSLSDEEIGNIYFWIELVWFCISTEFDLKEKINELEVNFND